METLIQELEYRLIEPNEQANKQSPPSLKIDHTPGSVTVIEVPPEHHDKKIYKTWSQFLLEGISEDHPPASILFCSAHRGAIKMIEYSVSHMADFDLSLTKRPLPTKGELLKLKKIIDCVRDYPLSFIDLEDISTSSLLRLCSSIEEPPPRLIIIEYDSVSHRHSPIPASEVQDLLQNIASTHSASVVVIIKQACEDQPLENS